MASSQLLGAGLSLAASFIFAGGLALQQKGNLAALRITGPRASRRRSVITTVTRPTWVAGMLGGGVVGFVVFAAALRIGSLSIVEPMQTTQMIFTVPLSAWVARTRVTTGEWGAASLLVLGLFLVTVTLAPEAGSGDGGSSAWLWIIPVFAGIAAVAVLASRRWTQYAAACLGVATGVLFGVQGGMVKESLEVLAAPAGLDVVGFLTSWSAWGAVIFTVVAVVLQNLALRAGRLSAAQTTITSSAPVASVIVGIAVFGETLQLDPVRILGAAVGAALCGWGIAHLARSPSLLAAAELAEPDLVDAADVADPGADRSGGGAGAGLVEVDDQDAGEGSSSRS